MLAGFGGAGAVFIARTLSITQAVKSVPSRVFCEGAVVVTFIL